MGLQYLNPAPVDAIMNLLVVFREPGRGVPVPVVGVAAVAARKATAAPHVPPVSGPVQSAEAMLRLDEGLGQLQRPPDPVGIKPRTPPLHEGVKSRFFQHLIQPLVEGMLHTPRQFLRRHPHLSVPSRRRLLSDGHSVNLCQRAGVSWILATGCQSVFLTKEARESVKTLGPPRVHTQGAIIVSAWNGANVVSSHNGLDTKRECDSISTIETL